MYPVPQTTFPASQVGPGAWHLLSAVQVFPEGQYPAPPGQQTLPVGIHLGLSAVDAIGRRGVGKGAYPVPQTTLPASQVGPGAWHLPSVVQVLPAGQYPAPEQQTLPVGIHLGMLVLLLERGRGRYTQSHRPPCLRHR